MRIGRHFIRLVRCPQCSGGASVGRGIVNMARVRQISAPSLKHCDRWVCGGRRFEDKAFVSGREHQNNWLCILRKRMASYLSLSTILQFLEAEFQGYNERHVRCLKEGEAILNSLHLLCCGIDADAGNNAQDIL